MELDSRQREEVLLTAAQSLFAVAVLSSLSFSAKEALTLLALFTIQFLIPTSEVRMAVTATYIAGALFLLITRAGQVRTLLRYALETARDPSAGHAHAEVRPTRGR
jgi:cation:H+ antiporter